MLFFCKCFKDITSCFTSFMTYDCAGLISIFIPPTLSIKISFSRLAKGLHARASLCLVMSTSACRVYTIIYSIHSAHLSTVYSVAALATQVSSVARREK